MPPKQNTPAPQNLPATQVNSTPVAVIATGAAGPQDLMAKLNAMLGGNVKMKRQVVLPVLRQEDNVPFAVLFQSPIAQAKKLANDDTKREPPKIAEVVNLESGELQTLICNAAMVSALEGLYPNNGYVGKSFGMVGLKRPNKERTLREYRIFELEVGPRGPSVVGSVIEAGKASA